MKIFRIALLLLFAAVFFTACGGEDAGNNGGDNGNGGSTHSGDGDGDGDSHGGGNIDKANLIISVWEGHSLKEESGNKGKWLASLTFGEEMSYLGDSVADDAGKRSYYRVELLDGKQGWVRADLVARGGELAAVTESALLYKRPSISNVTDDKLSVGDLVVVTERKDEQWVHVIARNDASGNRARGWILGGDGMSQDEIDVAVAVSLGRAMAEKNPTAKMEKLQNILDNGAYSGSKLLPAVELALENADPAAKLAADELMITGNVVNVRSAPNVEEDNVVFQVRSGDICKVVEKGIMDEISGNTDYWYKIRKGSDEGWLFGSNTTRKLE